MIRAAPNPIRTRAAALLAALATLLCLHAGLPPASAQEPPPDQPAYKDAGQHRRGYFGAGREEPEPQGLNSVLIGYFGPSDPGHPEGGSIWQALNLAIDDANADGGYKGIPFRLLQDWADNPWGDGSAKIVRMVYLERVWALIGSIDGASTHLAETVIAKARVPMLDPSSTDGTVNQANVPWMFSCLPPDKSIVAILGPALLDEAGDSFILLSATGHDSRALAAEFKAFLSRKRVAPRRHLEFTANAEQLDALAAQAASSSVKAVVIFAGPADSARLLREIRSRAPGLPVYGGPGMARGSFLAKARAAAELARVPILIEPSDAAQAVAARFQARFGVAPDYAALQAYDAMRLLAAAIRKAGLNRARILDALIDLSPWRGSVGMIEWDPLGRNTRHVRLGVIRDGQPAPF